MDETSLEKEFDKFLAEMRSNKVLSMNIVYRINYFIYRTLFLLIVLFVYRSNILQYLSDKELLFYITFFFGLLLTGLIPVLGILTCLICFIFLSIGITVRNENA